MRTARIAAVATALAASVPALAAGPALAIPSPLTVTPSQVTFPDTPMQMLSAPQTITFTNTADPSGFSVFINPSVSVTGEAADDYFITANTCRGDLFPGASCEVRVRFSPSALGTRDAALPVGASQYNGVDNVDLSVTVPLTGTGTSMAAGPSGQDGTNGANGTNGVDGQDGANGKDGANGVDGQNGANGKDGTNGAKGAKGAKGDKGDRGPRGVAVKFATRGKMKVGCKVTARGKGARIVCRFNRRTGGNWLVQLRDRRGALSTARGNHTKTMVFLSARKPRRGMHVFVIKGMRVR